MEGAYDRDLALIHNAGFSHVSQAAASLLVQELTRRGNQRGLVVDLGCGGGQLLAEVAAAGFQVRGVDASEVMLEIAGQRLPGGRFELGSVWDVEISSCVAVTGVGEVFNYLFDERAGQEGALKKLVERIFQSLEPGGVLLFDLAGPGRVPGTGQARRFMEGEGWAVLVDAEEDRERALLTRRITSFKRQGELYRRQAEEHRLRLHKPGEVLQALRQAGFRARVLRGYGTLRFPPGWRGFLASRPR